MQSESKLGGNFTFPKETDWFEVQSQKAFEIWK